MLTMAQQQRCDSYGEKSICLSVLKIKTKVMDMMHWELHFLSANGSCMDPNPNPAGHDWGVLDLRSRILYCLYFSNI